MICRWLSLFALAVIGIGCGPSTFTVSGKVSLAGQPIPDGSISFEAPDGSTPSYGGRIENGTYTVSKVPASAAGKKVVRIEAAVRTGRKIPAGPPHPPGTMVDEILRLPPRYNDKSKLDADLVPGKTNAFDFDLTTDPTGR